MRNRSKRGTVGRGIAATSLALSLIVSLATGAWADEKVGEGAIDAAMGELVGDVTTDPAASEAVPAAAPPADAPVTSDEEAPAEAPIAPEEVPAAEGDAAGDPAGDGSADQVSESSPEDSIAVDESTAGDSADSQADAPVAVAAETEVQSIEAAQPVADRDSGRVDRSRNDADREETSLAQTAMTSVLSGGSALPETATVAAIGGALTDSSDSPTGRSDGAAGDSVRAASQELAPVAFGPSRNRTDRPRANQPDNGTVVVNSLLDSGDEGKVAVHGNIVAGTLCDGSQFWSLDGGGTINANGVTLSANGGIAAADGSGGDDNIGIDGGRAGNGGSARASADGGIVVVDELVTGNNRGNEVTVGDQTFTGDCGHGVIDGGDVTTTTNLNISADGGVALADATGGDGNIAAGDGAGAGNGGRASASADGGIVLVGSLILGNNQGNTVDVNAAGTGTSGSGASGGGNSCLGNGSSINGGSMLNENTIDISADGGRALADASGGDDNIALGEDAAAGNGGRARANADGGLIMVDDIITGNNQGNSVSVECGGASGSTGSGGVTTVNGGTITNVTNLSINADGGTAIADASGGGDNIAGGTNGNGGIASAGNGGRATSNANGGFIDVGNIITGNNVGNVISVGHASATPRDNGGIQKTPRTIKPAPAGKPSVASPKGASGKLNQAGKARPARAARSVAKLPDTGTGGVATELSWSWRTHVGAAGASLLEAADRFRSAR